MKKKEKKTEEKSNKVIAKYYPCHVNEYIVCGRTVKDFRKNYCEFIMEHMSERVIKRILAHQFGSSWYRQAIINGSFRGGAFQHWDDETKEGGENDLAEMLKGKRIPRETMEYFMSLPFCPVCKQHYTTSSCCRTKCQNCGFYYWIGEKCECETEDK